MKAVVLAAGYATRLRPLTDTWAKELLPVGGRPILDAIVESIASVDEVDGIHVVTNARKAPAFHEWARGRDVHVHDDGTSSNDDRLGAIGDMQFVIDREGIDDDLLVIAGDNLFTGSIEGFVAEGRRREKPVLAVYDVGDLSLMPQFNTIETDSDGRITYFEEKPQRATSTRAGIALYWYPQRVLPLIHTYLSEQENHDQPGRLIEWLYSRTPVYAWELPGTWYDIGTPEQLEAARADFATESAQ